MPILQLGYEHVIITGGIGKKQNDLKQEKKEFSSI